MILRFDFYELFIFRTELLVDSIGVSLYDINSVMVAKDPERWHNFG
jgi:hypothetical protein